MRDLLTQLEKELPVIDPVDPAITELENKEKDPKGGEEKDEPPVDGRNFQEFAAAHLEYLRIFRQLEQVYDQMCHPQKRLEVRKALEVVLGRVLETRHWMKHLNHGVEHFALDDVAKDLNLDLDAFELPVPRSFISHRKEQIIQRETFIVKVLADKERSDKEPKDVNSGIDQEESAPAPVLTAEEKEAAEKASIKKHEIELAQKLRTVKALPMEADVALKLIQRNERARQSRQRSNTLRMNKREMELEEKALLAKRSEHDVAVICQALIRGFLVRRRCKRERDLEFEFLGMKMVDTDDTSPTLKDLNNAERRRVLRDERISEMELATVELKKVVHATESREMKEKITDTINTWFTENRDPITGEYPEFPTDEKGGSKDILDPPPLKPLPPPPEDPKVKAAREKKEAAEKKKAEAEAKKAADEAKKKGIVVKKVEPITTAPVEFVRDIRDCLEEFQSNWSGVHDLTDNFEQTHDSELVANKIRPAVFDQVRKEVDSEMREMLKHLKEMVAAEKGGGGGGGKGKKGKKGGKGGKKGGGKKSGGGKKAAGGNKGKGKKDPTADRTVESLFAELVLCGVVSPCQEGAYAVEEVVEVETTENSNEKSENDSERVADETAAEEAQDTQEVEVQEGKDALNPNPAEALNRNPKPHDPWVSPFPLLETFIGVADRSASATERKRNYDHTGKQYETSGSDSKPTAEEEHSTVYPVPTAAHARQIITTHVVLPIASSVEVKSKLPKHTKSVLLYGPKGSGKTFLTRQAAKTAGAILFDLSPRVIDQQYSGTKAIASLLHITFKVAKLMAPSIIYMDDSEWVFLTDKKVQKSLMEKQFLDKQLTIDAPSRVKKALLAEMKALKKSDQVVFVANARCPYALVKKDKKALLSFFDVSCEVPVPEYATRTELWKYFIEKRFAEGLSYNSGNNPEYSLRLPSDFVVHQLVVVSEGYSSGSIWEVICMTLRQRKIDKLVNDLDLDGSVKVSVDDFLSSIALVASTPKDEIAALREFTRSLPEFAKLKKVKDPPPVVEEVVDDKKK